MYLVASLPPLGSQLVAGAMAIRKLMLVFS